MCVWLGMSHGSTSQCSVGTKEPPLYLTLHHSMRSPKPTIGLCGLWWSPVLEPYLKLAKEQVSLFIDLTGFYLLGKLGHSHSRPVGPSVLNEPELGCVDN